MSEPDYSQYIGKVFVRKGDNDLLAKGYDVPRYTITGVLEKHNFGCETGRVDGLTMKLAQNPEANIEHPAERFLATHEPKVNPPAKAAPEAKPN
jgi:hypothetical protein